MAAPVFLLLFLALILPGSADAAPNPALRLARDDLALSRLLVCQEREMQVAAKALEDWAAGRLSGEEALNSARRAESRCRSLEAEIRQRGLTAEATLGVASRRAARSRTELVTQLVALMGKGRASRADLVAFNRQQSQLASAGLEGWLRGRLVVSTRILALRAPSSLAAYYRWQRSLLPLQLEQVALGLQIQEVLLEVAAGRTPRISGIPARGRELQGRFARLEVEPSLESPHRAALQEVESLMRLVEAVELLVGDPGPDSSARVSRFGDRLQKDSARTEEESLEALARSLGD